MGDLFYLAERVGFEPTARRRVTGFQDQLLKPLGHLSEYISQRRALLYYNPSGMSMPKIFPEMLPLRAAGGSMTIKTNKPPGEDPREV